MKYIIVGGVAGGASVAARLRRIDEQAEIILFERGQYISYANCGLPYYIGGTISERDNLFVQTPESFGNRFKVDVRVGQEVVAIHPDSKRVEVRSVADNSVYEESYDKLILSPGAEPVRPPIPGITLDGIFTLRNVPDTDTIKSYIHTHAPKRAVVVGAGFIGLEMAENLHDLGLQVTIIEMGEQVMNPVDYSMAALVHQHLKTKNIEFYLNTAVQSFEKKHDTLCVKLSSSKIIETDMVILSIGVRPETTLAKQAQLTIGETGGIHVNKYLQTSNEHIYALGDAIEFPNPITGTPMLTYLAGPANKQGRIVADNIVRGNTKIYTGSVNTAIAKVFDITVAATGLSGKALGKLSIPHIDSIIHASSHAGYYPGAMPMTIKISFSPTDGKLLGAQIIGFKGVDKRIDIFSEAIRKGATVHDLVDIEHAYAPPYSSAKDPVNMAGMVAENILNNTTAIISWREIFTQHADEYFLLDIRTAEEFALGSIAHAVNIPLDELRTRLTELPKQAKIVVFCGVGLRAYVAYRILAQHGFTQVYNLSGGLKTYETCTQKQSNEDIFENDFIGNDDQIYQGKKESHPHFDSSSIQHIDACGLQCPGPILKLKHSMDSLLEGETLRISASDSGFYSDVQSWARVTGNELIDVQHEEGMVIATLKKSYTQPKTSRTADQNAATLICFSDNLDKALATFVIANGAAASGKKVSIFFTFWGLNVIKKTTKPPVKKDFFGKMFGAMMASSSKKLGLSKMNFGGLGGPLMRHIMKKKHVDSLEQMIQSALDNNVEFIACQMSMDVMGVSKEELMEGVQFGGVATYLERTQDANLNLFI